MKNVVFIEAAGQNDSMQSGDDGFSTEPEMEEETHFMSILLTNLQINYDAWKAELPEEERKEEELAAKAEEAAKEETEDEEGLTMTTTVEEETMVDEEGDNQTEVCG